MDRYVQTLFLDSPPEFTIGGYSYITQPSPVGSSTISIRDPIIVGSAGRDFQGECAGGSVECFRPKVHVQTDFGQFVFTVIH